MDIVLRPVNDAFLEKILFPVFEMGMVNAKVALERLRAMLDDDHTRLLLDIILERGEDAALFPLQTEKWLEVCYRLVFSEWKEGPHGYRLSSEYTGYAASWDETLHLALMLEHPRYPYWDEEESTLLREACVAAPEAELGLAALVAGLWDPCPRFAPDQVLATTGRGQYKASDDLAIADWSYRPASTVSLWARQLPTKLGRLLKREEQRLKPLEMPEAKEILDYWTGRTHEPPLLTVAFSGLGARASHWVRDLGALARQLRAAAAHEQGLSSIVTTPSNQTETYDY